MCGRARLSSDVSEIKLVFSIPTERPNPNIPANWNAAPTEELPVVRYDARAGQRSVDTMRWGLVPFWAKDIKVGFANINAKAEGIETRPAFREAFARRRCLIPFDCFYEWKKLGKERQPYAVGLADRRLMALAGLWEAWRSPAGERVRSFAIVTTAANALLAEIHDRMPVILAPENWPVWLGEKAGRCERAEIAAHPISCGKPRHLAGRQARRQRQQQGSRADRAGRGGMTGARRPGCSPTCCRWRRGSWTTSRPTRDGSSSRNGTAFAAWRCATAIGSNYAPNPASRSLGTSRKWFRRCARCSRAVLRSTASWRSRLATHYPSTHCRCGYTPQRAASANSPPKPRRC
jgi:putative SOS response-associated peptidase YedK